MKQQLYILTLSLTLLSITLHSQQVQKSTYGKFLLQGGQYYDHDNGMIKGDILIEDGIIAGLGSNLSVEGAEIMDCSNLEIYPGMIDAGTKLGISEISAVSLTRDFNEIGTYTPHMKALTAVNPSSVNIPVTRVNGITTVLTVPEGGLFPGTAAAIDLQGYTPEQMSAGFQGVVLNFPSSGKRGRWDRRSTEDIKKDSDKNLKKLNDFWKQVVIYSGIKKKNGETDYNPQMEALVPIVNDGQPMLLEVNKKEDILSAITWVNKNEVKAIFTGVAEGYRVLDSLKKYEIPVITGPILNNPSRASDHYNVGYSNAGKMHKAGIQVAIRTTETENVRNLPYNTAFAAAYGMGWEAAFRSVTQTTADILGIGDRYGSLEKGKVANIFVTDGDPFETKTMVQYLFIRGWHIPLESRHTLLYDEFLDRSPGLSK